MAMCQQSDLQLISNAAALTVKYHKSYNCQCTKMFLELYFSQLYSIDPKMVGKYYTENM